MRVNPIMSELREGLDRFGIRYDIDDMEVHDEYGDGDTYIQCVTWRSNNTDMKAMYGWSVDYNGDGIGVTKGWRFGYLEWWPNGEDGPSFMATPEEILEAVS